MKKHVATALVLTGITYAVHLVTMPGPPFRVHLAAFVSLLIGFTAPALIVASWRQHVQRFAWTAALQISACIVLELLFSLTISKWEFRLFPILALVGVGFVALELLLLVHVALGEIWTRFGYANAQNA